MSQLCPPLGWGGDVGKTKTVLHVVPPKFGKLVAHPALLFSMRGNFQGQGVPFGVEQTSLGDEMRSPNETLSEVILFLLHCVAEG